MSVEFLGTGCVHYSRREYMQPIEHKHLFLNVPNGFGFCEGGGYGFWFRMRTVNVRAGTLVMVVPIFVKLKHTLLIRW
jgi:hypothetical protein